VGMTIYFNLLRHVYTSVLRLTVLHSIDKENNSVRIAIFINVSIWMC